MRTGYFSGSVSFFIRSDSRKATAVTTAVTTMMVGVGRGAASPAPDSSRAYWPASLSCVERENGTSSPADQKRMQLRQKSTSKGLAHSNKPHIRIGSTIACAISQGVTFRGVMARCGLTRTCLARASRTAENAA